MILIIAEKPSLGRNIAAGLGDFRRRDGYLEGENCLITWAFGHLFSLADIEHYRPLPEGTRGWSMQNLPCFPETFHYELRRGDGKQLDDGVLRQYQTIEMLWQNRMRTKPRRRCCEAQGRQARVRGRACSRRAGRSAGREA